METFSDLITRFGGAAKMAPEIGLSANAIRQWSLRGSIPGRYWQTIIDAAKRLGIRDVDAATLAALGDAPPKPKPRRRSAPANHRQAA